MESERDDLPDPGTPLQGNPASRAPLKKIVLFSFIVSLCCSAFVGIFTLLFGAGDGPTTVRILLTTTAVSSFSLLSMSGLALIEARKRLYMAVPSVVLTASTFLFSMVLIWSPECWDLLDEAGRHYASLIIFSISFSVVCLLSFARLQHAWVLWTTASLYMAVCFLSALLIFEVEHIESDGLAEFLAKALGSLVILSILGSIVVPILHKLDKPKSDTPPGVRREEITFHCPRCSALCSMRVGKSRCPKCGIHFTFDARF